MQKLPPIEELLARKEVWRANIPHQHDVPDDKLSLYSGVFERDNHTCAFCGFRSNKYQEPFHVDFVKSNITQTNIRTACFFCNTSLNAGVGLKAGTVKLIFCPELTQEEINILLRGTYFALSSGAVGAVSEAANNARIIFMERSEQLRKLLMAPVDFEMVFSDGLFRAKQKIREAALRRLDGLRIYPLGVRDVNGEDTFTDLVSYWGSSDGPYGHVAVSDWYDIYYKLTAGQGDG